MFKDIVLHPIFISLLIVLITLGLKFSVNKLAQKKAAKKAYDIRNISHNTKHFLSFIMVLLLLFVWSSEIQNFALSIAAFAVAIVIATREFIQCVIGFFYLVTTRPFKIGDWIQVGDYFGEVVETDWIKTTLHEIDVHTYQFSRKTIYIPNNKLITSSIKNVSVIKRYVTHHFSIVRKENLNPFPIYDALRGRAEHYCEAFQAVAARYNSAIERKLDASISGPEPEIQFCTTNLGEFMVNFRLFCPIEKALEIEHKLTQDFMTLWYEEVKRQSV